MARDVRRSIGRRARRLLGALALVGLVVLVATALGGCGGAEATRPPDATAPATTPARTPAAGTPAPSVPTSAGIEVDPALLGVLPATIDGIPIVELADAEADVRRDPAVGGMAERLAVGYAATTDRGDWAIAWVVGLRQNVFSDAMFRSWRDTYDAGACASQGGAAGHAEASLGGRQVSITTCGSVVVHHVHLEAPDRLVAVTSSGGGRFGERIVAALRP